MNYLIVIFLAFIVIFLLSKTSFSWINQLLFLVFFFGAMFFLALFYKLPIITIAIAGFHIIIFLFLLFFAMLIFYDNNLPAISIKCLIPAFVLFIFSIVYIYILQYDTYASISTLSLNEYKSLIKVEEIQRLFLKESFLINIFLGILLFSLLMFGIDLIFKKDKS